MMVPQRKTTGKQAVRVLCIGNAVREIVMVGMVKKQLGQTGHRE
jgi:hypothetical protein